MHCAAARHTRSLLITAVLLACSVPFATAAEQTAGSTEMPIGLDVAYVPTPQPLVQRMLEMAEIGPDDMLIDLASGDGRIPITAVTDFDAAGATGVDVDAERVVGARAAAREAGIDDKVTFIEANLLEVDLHEADVLTLYLLPQLNLRLRPNILAQMPAGSRVVSHAFDMGEWEADQHERLDGRDIYLWIVPAQVEGDWQFTLADGETFEVRLQQQYQRITGRANRNGIHQPLSSIALRGQRIEFSLDGERYSGVVSGDRITPADNAPETSMRGWRAQRH